MKHAIKVLNIVGIPGVCRRIRPIDDGTISIWTRLSVLTNGVLQFFVIFFDCFYLFSLRSGCFSALSKSEVSVVYSGICGWLCGQAYNTTQYPFRNFSRINCTRSARHVAAIVLTPFGVPVLSLLLSPFLYSFLPSHEGKINIEIEGE